MPGTTTKTSFWRGFRRGLPFILGAAPFGLLFGVLASEAGLTFAEVMSMSVLVIAGASQFTALSQMHENAPILMVLLASLAVNMRMAMYSAALAPHLGAAPLWQRIVASYILVDNSYAVAAAEFDERPQMSVASKMAFYFGCAVPVWIVWYLSTYFGAAMGAAIPPEFALDFAVPIAFLAIISPMLKTRAHVAAALTSVIVALALSSLPHSLGLFIAGALAMVVGAEVERRMKVHP